jgi:sugar phosphate isomerase/epimerase
MTMNRIISLAAGTILDADPPEAIRIAHRCGYPAVGVWYDHETWSTQRTRDVKTALGECGTTPLDIEPIMLTPTGDHGDAIVDVALEIGADNILVASRDPEINRVGERLAALAQRLGKAHTRIVLEFLPILAIKTLPDAVAAVEIGSHRSIGVLIDSLHLSRAGHHPSDLQFVDPAFMPYIQLCDAPAEPPENGTSGLLHEALHGRLMPGDGGLPLRELLAAVPNVPISLELRSERLRTDYPDPTQRAQALLDHTLRYLQRAQL